MIIQLPTPASYETLAREKAWLEQDLRDAQFDIECAKKETQAANTATIQTGIVCFVIGVALGAFLGVMFI